MNNTVNLSNPGIYFPQQFYPKSDSEIINLAKEHVITSNFAESATDLTKLKIVFESKVSIAWKTFKSVIEKKFFWIKLAKIVRLVALTIFLAFNSIFLTYIFVTPICFASIAIVPFSLIFGIQTVQISLKVQEKIQKLYHLINQKYHDYLKNRKIERLEVTQERANPRLNIGTLQNEPEKEPKPDTWYDFISAELLTQSELASPHTLLIDNFSYGTFTAIKRLFHYPLDEIPKNFTVLRLIFKESSNPFTAIQSIFRSIFISNLKIHHPFLALNLKENDQQWYIQDVCNRFDITPKQFIDCWNVPLTTSMLTEAPSENISTSEYDHRRAFIEYIDEEIFTENGFFIDEALKDLTRIQRILKFIALAPPNLAPFLSNKLLSEPNFLLLEKLHLCGFLKQIFSSHLFEKYNLIINQKETNFQWVSPS